MPKPVGIEEKVVAARALRQGSPSR